MDIYGLKNKRVLITGAAQGIGYETAKVFASYGANIHLVDIQSCSKQAEKLREFGISTSFSRTDVSSAKEVSDAVKEATNSLGGIDILVNCAGISTSGKIHELTLEEFGRVMSINAESVFLFSKEVANLMIKNHIAGRIVNISSQATKNPEYGNGGYICSKSVVNSITQVMAIELAEYGINVTAVSPGYINTEIMQKVIRERSRLENKTESEFEFELLENVPLRRMAEPSEIGEFIAFLSSDKASYITGVILTIAGGSTLF